MNRVLRSGCDGAIAGKFLNSLAAPFSVITTGHDRIGRKTSKGIQDGISENFTYTLDGNVLTNTISGNGIVSSAVTAYQYTPAEPDIVGMSHVAGDSTYDIRIVYNSRTKVADITNSTLICSYTYSTNANSIQSLTYTNASASIMQVDFDRNPTNQHLRSISYTINGSNAAEYAYTYVTNSDRIAVITLADNTYWQYEYDRRHQLTSAHQYLPDGTQIPGCQFGYAYDEIGNTIKAGPLAPDATPRYTFEANNLNFHVARIWSNKVELAGTASTNARVTINDHQCDRQGEDFRVTLTIDRSTAAIETNITVYAVDTNNIVATASGTLYLPQSPETISSTISGTTTAESRYTYTWNALDWLTSITSKDAFTNFHLAFDYYSDGRRARKRVYEIDGIATNLVREHHFYYDKWNLIQETQLSAFSTQVFSYVWGLDLAGQKTGKWGQTSGGINGLLSITSKTPDGTNTYIPVTDHNGNIRHLVDAATREIVATYEYSPFGVLIGESGDKTDVCHFRFMTKYYDPEIELYYYGHRYYDPASTKWLSRDPIAEQGGINMTAFCLNDPVNNVDPLGLAAYFFGGTHNSLDDGGWSNVEILFRAWDNDAGHGEKFYVPGVFSGYAPDSTPYTAKQKAGLLGEGIWGATLESRADYMIGLLETQLKAGDKEVNVAGFSRGSLTSLVFLNKIAQQVKDKNPLYAGIEINQTILFDTVAATKEKFPHELPSNLNYKYQPIHLIALDEQRTAFFDEEVLNVQGALQIGFRGVHANVGGGHNNNSLSREPLSFVRSMMEKSGMKVFSYRSMWRDMSRFGMMSGTSTPSDNDKFFYFMGHRTFPEGMFLSAGLQTNKRQLKNAVPGSLQFFSSEDQSSWMKRRRYIPGKGWIK